ncbi:MAG: NRDE family protein [Deltaproteobacteria bacterium]|nr:NRDE family protein [Deltaproteobacteria bacterium]
MCLFLAAIDAHPVYKLVIAANRDEFYERPTARAAFWNEAPHILAGKDLRAGGTWFGITQNGRIGAITNYRDPASLKSDAPSRGKLITDFLMCEDDPETYLSNVALRAKDYSGFNLVVGIKERLYWYSNRGSGIRRLTPGVHGLSNHLLDTPWPKVIRSKALLNNILVHHPVLSPEPLLAMLHNRTPAPDHALPDTGVGIERERILSPIFIVSPDYGTRSSTIVLLNREDRVLFLERIYGQGLDQHSDATFEFIVEG